jgi:peptide/nickel transport system substrate-binding protein
MRGISRGALGAARIHAVTAGWRRALGAAAMMGCGASPVPSPGHDRTVLFASGADLQTINPLLAVHPLAKQVQKYVLLVTLARYDSTLTARPYLARRWDWSDGGRTLTLHLYRGLRWHDGQPTTARDVAWTLNAARDPATGYPRSAELTTMRDVLAPNDSTVVIRFRDGVTRFPDVLTDLAMLPAHLLDSVERSALRRAEWNARPVGNGPFRFLIHEANRRWVFTANPAFPAALGGPPALERLIVVVVDEPTTKLAALAAGDVDFAGINPAHASFVRKRDNLAVIDYPLLVTYGVVLNTRRPPFDNPALRAALSLAINRREIVDGYLYGFGTPAAGPVPPDLPGSEQPAAPLAESPDSARAILHAHGKRVTFELLTVGSGEAALEQMVQARLMAVGFDVRIRQLELSAYLDRVYGQRRDFDAAVLGIQGDLALGYLSQLADLAGVTSLAAARDPIAFLYHARGVQGANTRVRGVRMDLRGELTTVTRWTVTP